MIDCNLIFCVGEINQRLNSKYA